MITQNYIPDNKILSKSNNNLINNNVLKSNPNNKEENLFSNKSQKEIILGQIKSAQMSILSEIKKETSQKIKNQKYNVIIFKDILIELKNNLLDLLKEKKIKMNYLKKQFEKKKKFCKKRYF